MAHPEFWLASNSPRRREILSWIGWDVRSSAANIDESRRENEAPQNYVMRLAAEKATHKLPETCVDSVVIAADTAVVLNEDILGKPADSRHAREMLSALRDREHWVMTGIAVRACASGAMHQDICRTRVRMRAYSDEEIEEYVASGDPLDKAGAYAIQNPVFYPAVDFRGCFASVMGMPLCHLERLLNKFTFYEPIGLADICQNHLKYNCPISSRVMAGEDVG